MAALRMRVAATAVAVLTVFALAGCGDDEDQAASSAGAASDAADAAPEAAPETAPVDSDAIDAEDANDADAGGEECLHGNWYVDNVAYSEMLERAGGTIHGVTGWAIVTYHPDGTSMTTFDEWTTIVVQDGVEATMVRDGEDRGTYTVSGDTLTTTETDAGSVLTMTTNSGGQQITVEAPHEELEITSGTFTCEAETLTVVANGAESVLMREH